MHGNRRRASGSGRFGKAVRIVDSEDDLGVGWKMNDQHTCASVT